jgi:DsbC/DsbD-like thiol-disulfide interchange protein
LALLLAAGAVDVAEAASSDWATGAKTRARLIAAGVGADGRLDAAIEIALPAGWKTYWRNPGTAGIAPEFDFAGSANAAAFDVAFPLPERVDDGFSVTNVYEGGVVLPLTATVTDPARPVDLAVTIRLGVCDAICVPDELHLALTVPPGEKDAAAALRIAAVRMNLPGPPQPGVLAVDSVVRNGGTDGKPVFRISATVPAGTTPQVFVEGPADWAAYAPVAAGGEGGHAVFDVKFSRLGAKTPIAGAAIRVTMAAGGRAIDQTIALD